MWLGDLTFNTELSIDLLLSAQFLDYGPYGSFAPVVDSSYINVSVPFVPDISPGYQGRPVKVTGPVVDDEIEETVPTEDANEAKQTHETEETDDGRLPFFH